MKFSFTINTLFIGLLTLILGYGITSYYLQKPDPYEVPTGALPVPIQVGRNKLIVSKTGDASMSTEYRRRRTIIGSNSCGISPKFSHQGSTNGSLETYFLSSMCPTFIKQLIPTQLVLYDTGDAYTEAVRILDGGDASGLTQEIEIDLGDAYTTPVYFI